MEQIIGDVMARLKNAGNWRAIETAPKGKEVIVWTRESGIFVAINTDSGWIGANTKGLVLFDKKKCPKLWIDLGDPLY